MIRLDPRPGENDAVLVIFDKEKTTSIEAGFFPDAKRPVVAVIFKDKLDENLAPVTIQFHTLESLQEMTKAIATIRRKFKERQLSLDNK